MSFILKRCKIKIELKKVGRKVEVKKCKCVKRSLTSLGSLKL
jgi:hypothetical protein